MRVVLLWLLCLLVPGHALGATLLVLGDSLSAAYGLPPQAGWVNLMQERMRAEKFALRVVNASISGETSAGGASRIERLLTQHRPSVMILALGANDGLRGLPLAQMRQHLDAILRAARQRNVRILLVGMRIPPNYGPSYTREFEAVFRELSAHHRTAFVPFLLHGFADRPEFFLPDGIHPNAAAQPLMLANVWPALRPLLR